MNYTTIKPPFTLNFREMPKKELREYFDWFQGSLLSRLDILQKAVQETSGFADWQADLTPDSLVELGDWFATQVESRTRTPEEMQAIENRQSHSIGLPREELTDRTFSLAMDIGMYLSQVFLKNNLALRWEQPLGNKKDVDFGQPVLIGFGAAPFNPVRMLVTHSYGIAGKSSSVKSLGALYTIWSKMCIDTAETAQKMTIEKQVEILNQITQIMNDSAGSIYEEMHCKFSYFIDEDDWSVDSEFSVVRSGELHRAFLALAVDSSGKAKTNFTY